MNLNEKNFDEKNIPDLLKEKDVNLVLEESLLKIKKMTNHYKFMFFIEIILYLIGACLLAFDRLNSIAMIFGALFITISLISTLVDYIFNVLLIIEFGYLKIYYKSAESFFYIFLVGLFLILPTLIGCFAIKKFHFIK